MISGAQLSGTGAFKIAVQADGLAIIVKSLDTFGSTVFNYCAPMSSLAWPCFSIILSSSTGSSSFDPNDIGTIALDNSNPQRLYVNSFDGSGNYLNYVCDSSSFSCTDVPVLDTLLTNLGVGYFSAYAFDNNNRMYVSATVNGAPVIYECDLA